MQHRIVTKQASNFPFKKFWVCVCGTRMMADVMGPPLYKEFAEHELKMRSVEAVKRHRQDFMGHSAGSVFRDGAWINYCIDCDWDGGHVRSLTPNEQRDLYISPPYQKR